MKTKVSFETMPRAIEELLVKMEKIESKIGSPEPKKAINDIMLFNDALEFLKENGRPTSKSTLYKETSLGWIPSKKVGKRRIFSRKDLKVWLDSGMPKQVELDAIDRLSDHLQKYDYLIKKGGKI